MVRRYNRRHQLTKFGVNLLDNNKGRPQNAISSADTLKMSTILHKYFKIVIVYACISL